MASGAGTGNSAEGNEAFEAEDTAESVDTFIALLVGAFNELHTTVLQKIATPHQNFMNHADYPRRSFLQSGFPYFSETGYYEEHARKDYVGSTRPMGILGMFVLARDKKKSPEMTRLIEFIDADELWSNFKTADTSAFEVERIVGQAVESYFQRFGRGPLDKIKRTKVLAPIVRGAMVGHFGVRVVVPIALTHFDFDRFRLNETSYVARIPNGLQLSRARMDVRGSGAVRNVVGAATHAFVSTGWTIDFDTNDSARQSMNNPSKNVLDEIDLFFAALRAATGVQTGYAQVLMVPQKVAFELYCDLPPTFGATYRRYPAYFDNYAWADDQHPWVSKDLIQDVKRLYNLSIARPEQRVRIALKRLNACMTRDDAVDAILDAMIGLEVLLGDEENQALSYKLRMRAGGLAALTGDRSATEVSSEVNRIYGIRSKIVHGLASKEKGKKVAIPEEERYAAERNAAAAMLRYVLDVLLENPRYLDPKKIDRELLLGVAPEVEPGAVEPDLFPS